MGSIGHNYEKMGCTERYLMIKTKKPLTNLITQQNEQNGS